MSHRFDCCVSRVGDKVAPDFSLERRRPLSSPWPGLRSTRRPSTEQWQLGRIGPLRSNFFQATKQRNMLRST
jgi:hypothetical protein